MVFIISLIFRSASSQASTHILTVVDRTNFYVNYIIKLFLQYEISNVIPVGNIELLLYLFSIQPQGSAEALAFHTVYTKVYGTYRLMPVPNG